MLWEKYFSRYGDINILIHVIYKYKMPLVILINFFSIPLCLENNGHKTRYPSFASINIFTKYDLLQFINSWSFFEVFSWWPTVHVLYTPSPILHHTLDSINKIAKKTEFLQYEHPPPRAPFPPPPDNNTKPCILSIKDPQLLINLVHNFTKFLHFR